jgi:hypothetical protein
MKIAGQRLRQIPGVKAPTYDWVLYRNIPFFTKFRRL